MAWCNLQKKVAAKMFINQHPSYKSIILRIIHLSNYISYIRILYRLLGILCILLTYYARTTWNELVSSRITSRLQRVVINKHNDANSLRAVSFNLCSILISIIQPKLVSTKLKLTTITKLCRNNIADI